MIVIYTISVLCNRPNKPKPTNTHNYSPSRIETEGMQCCGTCIYVYSTSVWVLRIEYVCELRPCLFWSTFDSQIHCSVNTILKNIFYKMLFCFGRKKRSFYECCGLHVPFFQLRQRYLFHMSKTKKGLWNHFDQILSNHST